MKNIKTSYTTLLLVLITSFQALAGDSTNVFEKSIPGEVSTSRFDFSWRLDAPLLIGGTGLAVAGYFIKDKVTPLTVEEITTFNPESINAFDRGAIRQDRSLADNSSDIILAGTIIAPLTLLVSKPVRQDYLPVFAMYLETAAVIGGLTNITKGLASRNRPYVYNPDIDINTKLNKGDRHSFWSGHVSNATAFSVVTAYMVSRYADRNYLKVIAWSGAVAIPATVGVLRYSAGKHYPTDIITGFVVGAATGFLIPYVHRKKLPQDTAFEIKFYPTRDGVGLIAVF